MKKYIYKIALVFFLMFTFNFIIIETTEAQCPMCKMSAESDLKNGGNVGRGLNKGILYLFAAPYLMIGGLAFMYFRNKNKGTDEEDIIKE